MFIGPQNPSHSSIECGLTSKKYSFTEGDRLSRKRAKDKIDADQDAIIRAIAKRKGKHPRDVSMREMMRATGAMAQPPKPETREDLDRRTEAAIAERERKAEANPYASELSELKAERHKHDVFRRVSDPRKRQALDDQIVSYQLLSDEWEEKHVAKVKAEKAASNPKIKEHLQWAETEYERALIANGAPPNAAADVRSLIDDLKSGAIDVEAAQSRKEKYMLQGIDYRAELRSAEYERRKQYDEREEEILGPNATEADAFVKEMQATPKEVKAVEKAAEATE